MGSKTVAELIEFLKTQPQDMVVTMMYDSMESYLYIIDDGDNKLTFTHEKWKGDTVLFSNEGNNE